MTHAPERFRKITEYGVIPAPAGAGALLLHAEEGLDCLLVLGVSRPADKAQLTATVTFGGVHAVGVRLPERRGLLA